MLLKVPAVADGKVTFTWPDVGLRPAAVAAWFDPPATTAEAVCAGATHSIAWLTPAGSWPMPNTSPLESTLWAEELEKIGGSRLPRSTTLAALPVHNSACRPTAPSPRPT